MSIWDSTRAIGIELELYTSHPSKILDKIHDQSIKNTFHICSDMSLRTGGVEIKFKNKQPICHAQNMIKALHTIALDDETSFRTNIYNKHIPKEIIKSEPVTRREGGTTGLHVHCDIPMDTYSPLDVLYLLQKTTTDRNIINDLAWRNSRQWASDSRAHTEHISAGLIGVKLGRDNSLRDPIVGSGEAYTNMINLPKTKFIGVNLKNLMTRNTHKSTIEFRYGDAALMRHPEAFEKYLTYINDAMDESFVGRTTMAWNHTCILKWDPLEKYKMQNVKLERNGYSETFTERLGCRKLEMFKYNHDGSMGDKIKDVYINI